MGIDSVAISAQYPTFFDLSKDSRQRISVTLYHVRQVNRLSACGSVFGRWVEMIELQGLRVGIISAYLAPAFQFDLVRYLSR